MLSRGSAMEIPANQPAVSVIIPVYNAESFLPACLDSVLAQSLHAIEVICVDDGSTDRSLEILQEYARKDARIVIVPKSQNTGYGATVNQGIDLASSEYVTILEPDDKLCTSGVYAHLLESARKHNADVAKGDYNFYWSKGSRRANALRSCPLERPVNARTCGNLFALPLSVWSALYRKSFLTKNNIRFLESPGASYQDNAFSFKVFASADNVILLNKAIVDYRQDNPNASMKSKTKVFCITDEIHEIERWLEKNPELQKSFAYDKWLFHYKAYFANLQRTPRKQQKDFFELFRREFLEAQIRGELPKELFQRLGRRLPLLLNSPKIFLFYFRLRALLDALRQKKKYLLTKH